MIESPPGLTFGRLTVLSDSPSIKSRRMVLCKCQCGETKIINWFNLKTGRIISCGCAKREHYVKFSRKHKPDE